MAAANMTMRGNGRGTDGANGLRTARFLLLGFGFLLGAVLIANGSTLIGVLIAGFAAARLTFFLVARRRRRLAFAHVTAAATTRQVLRPYARSGFIAAATTIGVSLAELRTGFERGSSIGDLAAAHGVAVADVIEAIVRSVTVDLDTAAARGTLSADQAARAKDLLPSWAARLTVGTRSDFQGL